MKRKKGIGRAEVQAYMDRIYGSTDLRAYRVGKWCGTYSRYNKQNGLWDFYAIATTWEAMLAVIQHYYMTR